MKGTKQNKLNENIFGEKNMVSPKTNKPSSDNLSRTEKPVNNHENKNLEGPGSKDFASIPISRGKGKLIAGFLLSGKPLERTFQVIRTLELDATLGSPTTTSYIRKIMRRLQNDGLLDSRGFPTKVFGSRAIYDGYEEDYLKFQNPEKQLDPSENVLEPNNSDLTVPPKPSGTPGEDGKDFSKKSEDPQKNMILAMMKQAGMTPADFVSENNGGEVPPGSTNNPDMTGLTEPQRFQKMIDMMTPEQHRAMARQKQKKVGQNSKGAETMLQCYQMLENDVSMVMIMEELHLDSDTMLRYGKSYNEIRNVELEKKQLAEPYLKAWFDFGAIIGENVRRGCPDYDEVNGVCKHWNLTGLPKQYREVFRGVYRSGRKKGEGFYVNVGAHAELCTLCQRRTNIMETA